MRAELSAWLAEQARTIVGVEAACAVIGVSAQHPAAEWSSWPADAQPSARVRASLEAVFAHGEACVQPPSSPDPRARGVLALPLRLGGELAGAVGLEVRGLGEAQLKAVVERLSLSLQGLERTLELGAECERLGSIVTLAAELLEHETPSEAAHALARALRRTTGCSRAAVAWRRRGRSRLLALSDTTEFADESKRVQAIECAMDEAVEQDAVIDTACPSDAVASHSDFAHRALLEQSEAERCATVPLVHDGEPVGALLCEWNRTASGSLAAVEDAARLAGPLVAALERADASPWARARRSIETGFERRFQTRTPLGRSLIVAVACGVLLWLALPMEYAVSAPASLEGQLRRALVAPVAGYVAEASARAGDEVRAGDVLMRLDDRDLRLSQRGRESEREQLEKEYREALAQGDRTQVRILRSRIEKAEAQLRLADEELGRATVRAPFDGIIVKGELSHALGSPVERGELLYEVTPLAGYRVVLRVDEREIAHIEAAQTGRLTLSAMPSERLPLRIERITPIAEVDGGRNRFRVEATLDEAPAALRPGMEGIAKVDTGAQRRLWVYGHSAFDWLRLRLWEWAP